MRGKAAQGLTIIVLVGILWLMHAGIHQYTVSLVIFPIALAGLLPYILPTSLVALLSLIIGAELLTSMPPGVMTAAIIIPFLIRRLIVGVIPAFTLRFFGFVALTAAIQFCILMIALAGEVGGLRNLPIGPVLLSFTATTLTVYLCAAMWFEWFVPIRRTTI